MLALPISYYLAHSWLEGFAYHVELSAWHLLIAIGIVWVISSLTIAALIFKAAKTNPSRYCDRNRAPTILQSFSEVYSV